MKNYQNLFESTVTHLQTKKQILFLTTSNRWRNEKDGEEPKSSQLAKKLAEKIGVEKVKIIDVSKLKIYPCEGNVSTVHGNTCGVSEALLKDNEKNPSGCHRCWASLNNPDDELWQVSKALFESEAVVFFGSVRWGQMNSFYQKLIERLTWLENRHSTLGEDNILKNIEAGIIAVGHNWRADEVVGVQKKVFSFFGFQVPEELSWAWIFTTENDESNDGYLADAKDFKETFLK
jgi:multimeric flavodoxin WrbA